MTAAEKALNRLAKWRTVLTGWQLGTRHKGDPEGDAVRDHRELSLLLRAEVSALAGLLIKKGVFTAEEWDAQLAEEAEAYSKMLSKRFPGFTATDSGMAVNAYLARDTMKDWRP